MEKDIEKRKQDFEEIYFNEIGMCGCGRPDEVKRFIYELLKNHKEGKEDKITWELMGINRERIIKQTDTDVIFEFVFHVLGSSGLLEHGGSIYGSWLTDDGEYFLDLLEQDLSDSNT